MTPSDPTRIPILRPRPFLLGLLFGLAGLAGLGAWVARTDYHPGFVRFISPVSPEGSYYPTVDEMVAIVRSHCRKDQTLVIVGGNSILLGVWQPVDQVWTKHLQEMLGDKYCVLNFAFRGAAPADCGAVVAEVLRKEYPHQIYIADEAELNGVSCIGSEAYRTVFWQAYFSGRLETDASRDQRVRDYLYLVDEGIAKRGEIIAANVADSVLHYRDLWNWVSYNLFFTIPSLWGATIPGELVPRKAFTDQEPDSLNPELRSAHYPPEATPRELEVIRAAGAASYVPGPNGTMVMRGPTRSSLQDYYREAFPPDLKPRTLILVSENSPFYRRQLEPAELALDEQARRESLEIWHAQGYPAFIYGTDFSDDDFADRTHLSRLGGAKLAAAVAPEVRKIADRLGYNQ